MPITSPPNKYLAKEVSQILNISKKTLYDWEARGIIPVVPRDWRGWRIYDEIHLAAITKHMREKGEKGGGT